MAEYNDNNKPDELLEAEKKEAFLREYRELVLKYGYDWFQPALSIIKVNFKKDDSK